MELSDLPPECIGNIVSYISDTFTIQGLLRVSKTIAEITRENVQYIERGTVAFLAQFRRLVIVKESIFIQDRTDIDVMASLPQLRVASFQLTSTFFQKDCREHIEKGFAHATQEIKDRMNVASDISDLIQPNVDNLIAIAAQMIPLTVYTTTFICVIKRFLLFRPITNQVFSFATSDEKCIYSRIQFGDGRLSIDNRDITCAFTYPPIDLSVFPQQTFSPFELFFNIMPISHLRCSNEIIKANREDFNRLVPNLREFDLILTPLPRIAPDMDQNIQLNVVSLVREIMREFPHINIGYEWRES